MLGPNPGYFIEIGGFDGVTLSNTYLLEQQGWSGLLVEPLPEHFARLDTVRSCDKWEGAIGLGVDTSAGIATPVSYTHLTLPTICSV